MLTFINNHLFGLKPYVNNYCTLYTHKQTKSSTSLLSNLAVKVGSAFLAFLTVSCFRLDCKQALGVSRTGTSVFLDRDIRPASASLLQSLLICASTEWGRVRH